MKRFLFDPVQQILDDLPDFVNCIKRSYNISVDIELEKLVFAVYQSALIIIGSRNV